MHVYFCAALDGVTCDDSTCPCGAWIRSAGAKASKKKGRKKAPPSGHVSFPARAQDEAVLDALGRSKPSGGTGRPDGWADFPVHAWRTPEAFELGFSTLCPTVRAALAAADEPVAIATADGGWRRELSVFTFADGLQTVRVRPRTTAPWADYADLRDAMLDIIGDRRQPLLARLADIAAITATVVEHKGVPPELPTFTARSFLAWRGFLEARAAAANPKKMAAFANKVAPLFESDAGLVKHKDAIAAALSTDWRGILVERVASAEREFSDALENYLGARVFALPVVRDVSLARAYAEFYEAFAVGLRYLAALCELHGRDADAGLAVASMALGEHFVNSSKQKLAAFVPPPPSHDRAPRVADVDMTLASIC